MSKARRLQCRSSMNRCCCCLPWTSPSTRSSDRRSSCHPRPSHRARRGGLSLVAAAAACAVAEARKTRSSGCFVGVASEVQCEEMSETIANSIARHSQCNGNALQQTERKGNHNIRMQSHCFNARKQPQKATAHLAGYTAHNRTGATDPMPHACRRLCCSGLPACNATAGDLEANVLGMRPASRISLRSTGSRAVFAGTRTSMLS